MSSTSGEPSNGAVVSGASLAAVNLTNDHAKLVQQSTCKDFDLGHKEAGSIGRLVKALEKHFAVLPTPPSSDASECGNDETTKKKIPYVDLSLWKRFR